MAFTRRVLAGLVTIVTVVLGLSLAVAGSAAADTGSWQAYGNKNPITTSSSSWVCGDTDEVATDVRAQVCAVRSPSGRSVQAAVIVRNNRSSVFGTDASTSLWTYLGGGTWKQVGYAWNCPWSGVGPDSWSVCFGRTLSYQDPVAAQGYANDYFLDASTLNY